MLFIILILSYYYINKVEFQINVTCENTINYLQKRNNDETIKYDFYTVIEGKRKDIVITRKDSKTISLILDVKKNSNNVTAFYVGSYNIKGKHNIREGWSFDSPNIQVEPYIVLVSPKNKVIAKRVYPKSRVSKLEWINNKVLKLETGKPAVNEYIKNPFNLTIFERIIEEGKELIPWINHKGWR
ncbi:MAG: hypothetical protein FH762_20025 [Firmicutes bacterium]|nr:hypothetical protein [Bacillota bacterium]